MGNNKFKILIVEDDHTILNFIQTLLEANGYQILTADRCDQGLLVYASHRPDLVILDLGLPDRDGLEFIREIRQGNPVPIVVLSARNDESDKVEALDLGANDYVTKPFGTEEDGPAPGRPAQQPGRHDERPARTKIPAPGPGHRL